MAQDPRQPDATPDPDAAPRRQRHMTSGADQVKARKWFAHAKKAAETKNYDYAVELYSNGLAVWPDNIEEGLKPLRVVATARRLNRGKPAGFLEAKKRAFAGRDPVKNLANAIYLFGMDPVNVGHMEHILQFAAKANLDKTVQWIAPVLVEALMGEKKVPEKRFSDACTAMDWAAELAAEVGDFPVAIDILQANLRAAQLWAQQYPTSAAAQQAYSNVSSKQTIVKGRFASAADFRESLKDAEEQKDIRDRDSVVLKSVDRHKELVDKARRDWQENRAVAGKLISLIDLLIRREEDEPENEAIALLDAEYAEHKNYTMKSKADDIRMRQLSRHARQLHDRLKASPQDEAIRKDLARALARQNKTEIAIFRERLAHYPTDMRLRFQLATRLFKAKEYDEAIPLFQQAQSDGRHRVECRVYLGRCFLEKGFSDQAVETLRAALAEMETTSTDAAKELQYWLGRAYEVAGQNDDAKKTYGQLIQLDYNFKDARKRLEAIAAAGRQAG